MTHRLRRLALLASIPALATAQPALAQQEQAPPPPAEPQTTTGSVEEPIIVVTGTRRIDRTVADSPVPVDVIGADAISRTGYTETNKILNQLVPSFNFPQPSIADGSDAVRPATLRGLGPDQTLVLINGKRRHVSALLNINGTVGRGSAAVDLNTIPALAIGRVEVLRDGAAAQYGSDAIAGVINIRLKEANKGGRASMTYGQYFTTIDDVAKVTGLVLDGAGQPMIDPTTNPADPYLLANTKGERKAHDGTQVAIGVNLGLPIGQNGFVNLTGEFRNRDQTNRAGYDLRVNFNRPAPPAFDPREADFNRLQFRFGDPESRDWSVFLNSGIEISPGWDAYAVASLGHRRAESSANWRRQRDGGNRDFSVLLPAESPNAQNFVPLTDIGFLPLIETDLDDYAATVGIRADVMGWALDLSAGRGHNSFDYKLHDTLNTSFGAESQRDFDAGGLRYGQTIFNLDLVREYDFGFAKPIAVAVGAEHRREQFEVRAGDFQSWAAGPLFRPAFETDAITCAAEGGVYNSPSAGFCRFPGREAPVGAQGFPGIPDASETEEDRHSWSAYAELDTDIVEGLTTTLAGRYEHYSDFGSTLNGKFAARWEPVAGYAIRGSASTGFRAPSLHQQFFSTTSTNFIGGVAVDIATLPVDAPAARALGAKDLKPEKSINFSFGATANPFLGLTFTADAYQISIDDRIVLTEVLGTGGTGNTPAVQAEVTALLADLGFPQVKAARFFINGLDTRTRGVDLVAAYTLRSSSLGRWNFTAAYNWNKTKIKKRSAAPGELAEIEDIVLFGRVEGIRFTEGQPRDKIVLSADGEIRQFGLTARTTRYGKVVSPGAAAPVDDPLSLTDYGPDDIFLGRKWITDLELRYSPDDRIEFALGSNNLFDVYPDRSPFGPRPASVGGTYPVNQIYIPYSIFSPFGFNGRYVYARVGVNF